MKFAPASVLALSFSGDQPGAGSKTCAIAPIWKGDASSSRAALSASPSLIAAAVVMKSIAPTSKMLVALGR